MNTPVIERIKGDAKCVRCHAAPATTSVTEWVRKGDVVSPTQAKLCRGCHRSLTQEYRDAHTFMTNRELTGRIFRADGRVVIEPRKGKAFTFFSAMLAPREGDAKPTIARTGDAKPDLTLVKGGKRERDQRGRFVSAASTSRKASRATKRTTAKHTTVSPLRTVIEAMRAIAAGK